MQDDWTSPSGSRWEPAAPPVTLEAVGSGPRRRYRRPVVAVLLTLLGAGAVAGAAAYAQSDVPTASAPSGSSAVSGPDGHDGPHGRDHHGPRS